MPRYYDLDKLSEMIEARAAVVFEGKQAFWHVAKWLDLLPAADVVPRDEVDKARLQGYESGKKEVAREIFEEIEKIILDNTYPDFNREHKPVNIWKATTGYDAFYELKKKYTEEKKDEKN